PVSDFSAINQTSLNDSTDTRVRKATIEGGFQYSIYTTCANNATIGGGDGYYQWCKRQLVLFDPGHAHAWKVLRYEDPATPGMKGRNFFACHELGHTTGLQHPGTLYGGRNTCMDYDGHWYLDAHERQH
ncbi:MAG: hypothetical protein M3365_06100, partial [Gemmatimonadota bacterium]|nr:hypothetical protein [Gemmatimonadota bacterium]